MISKKIQDAINAQIQAEMYSSNLYLSMAAYCESINMKGFAHWMRLQAGEELMHAHQFFDYVIQREGRALVGAIDAPPQDFKSPRDVFEQTLAHEKKVTGLVNGLYELALAEKDYATQSMLQWFINEQVEEEKNATAIVETLKTVGTQGASLFMVDRQLAARG